MQKTKTSDIMVGLFGTCGGSKWREPYIDYLMRLGVSCFDPQITPKTHGREWCVEDIDNERQHLLNDPILMFKLTGETTGLSTLNEIMSVISGRQIIIVLIEPLNIDPEKLANDQMFQEFRSAIELKFEEFAFGNPIKDASRARAWVQKYVESLGSPIVVNVSTDGQALLAIEAAVNFLKFSATLKAVDKK